MAGVGVAAGVTAGAIYALSGRIAKLAGVADEAVKTGLSGEFLQRLGYAADQSGVSVQTLTMGVKNLTLAVGKGNEKPFESIGISLKELKGLQPDEQFLRVATAISKIQTPADRMNAAMQIFGRSGKDMAGLFAGGLNDVNKLLREAKELGIGISDADLAMIAETDDSIQRMKSSFGALADKATVVFAPAIASIADTITGWMTPLNKFADGFNALPNKAEFLADVMSAAWDVGIETIKTHWDDMLKSLLSQTWTAATKIHDMLSPTAWAVQGLKGLGIPGLAAAQDAKPGAGLDAAKARFGGLMGQLSAAGAAADGPFVGPQNHAAKGTGDFAGLFGGISDKLAGPVAAATMAGKGIIDRAKLDLGWAGNVLAMAFTGEPAAVAKTSKAFEPRTAGAMQRGSVEAYSTIVQAMMRNGSQDPNVKATEKQTKELVKALKSNPPVKFSLVDDLMGAFGR